MFEVFFVVFAGLILIGMWWLLRRRKSLEEQTMASLGLALGFGLGGAFGLLMSAVAGTFVYILPVSLGVGLALGFSIGWVFDSLTQAN